MKKTVIIALLACIGLSIHACKKGPGEGGRASIRGKVFLTEFNSSGIPVDSFYVPEHRVYLIYGDDPSFSEEVRTNFDGTYVFEYLLPGDYKVFTYSECKDCSGDVEAVLTPVEINGKKENKELEDLRIAEY